MKYALISLLLTICFPLGAQVASPKHEVRAVWLTTLSNLDWPRTLAKTEAAASLQKEELCNTLDQLRDAGINTVLLQTRVRSTTIYPSAYEPWDASLTGTAGRAPSYDPLAFAIEECHKRGMELHAWVVTIPVGKWNSLGCQRLRKKYPKLIRKIGDEGYLNPEMAQTATYLSDICAEITQNYDIDGIHLDYIRYPENWKIKVSKAQGRQYITNIAAAISHRVKALKPWVKMSCSPIGKHDDLARYRSNGWNARTVVCQDAQAWLRDGLMDQLYPMMYFQGNNFFPFAIDWHEQSYGRTIVSGLGIYFLSPRERNWSLQTITEEMQFTRHLGMGHAYFRSRFFTENTKGLYTFARDHFDATPALVPPMTWMNAEAPQPSAKVTLDNQTNTLTWEPVSSSASYILYNVYASTEWPVDTENPQNLMAVRLRETSLQVPAQSTTGPASAFTSSASAPIYYAVTAYNRYGIESPATQSHHLTSKEHPQAAPTHHPHSLLPCDGKTLYLPPASSQSDSQVYAVATMQGNMLKTLTPQGTTIDVSNMGEGIYQLRILQRKGNSHLVGHFIIRRSRH